MILFFLLLIYLRSSFNFFLYNCYLFTTKISPEILWNFVVLNISLILELLCVDFFETPSNYYIKIGFQNILTKNTYKWLFQPDNAEIYYIRCIYRNFVVIANVKISLWKNFHQNSKRKSTTKTKYWIGCLKYICQEDTIRCIW